MRSLWYFVPKSGVAFILISVVMILIWNGYKANLNDPYFWIFSAEFVLFFICFFIADRESEIKQKKS